MILNNYNKTMNEIRLSEQMQEEIVKNILQQDIAPKRKFVWWKPVLAVMTVMVLALFLLPRQQNANLATGGSAPAVAMEEEAKVQKEEVAMEYATNTTSEAIDEIVTLCPFEVIDIKEEGEQTRYIGEHNELTVLHQGKHRSLSELRTHEFEIQEEYRSVIWHLDDKDYQMVFKEALDQTQWESFIHALTE